MAATLTSFDIGVFEAGSVARLVHVITEEEVEAFAKLTGDRNPLHMDVSFAQTAGFRGRVVHGILTAGLVSRLIGMELPGAGSLWARQQFEWLEPVFIGDRLEVTVTATSKSEGTRSISVQVEVRNQNGRTVMQGNGVVRMPEIAEQIRAVPLGQRCVMVTGGDTPLGSALAGAMSAAGAKVALLHSTNASAPSDGGEVFVLRCTAGPGAYERCVRQAADRFGQPVDVLVHAANARFTPETFSQLSWQEMERQLNAGLKTAFHVSQAVLPGMIEAGSGVIVNIGSSAAWGVPAAEWMAHTVAAAALQAFTKSLAVELGPKRIRVNTVSTGLLEGGGLVDMPDRLRKLRVMQTPLRRLTSIEDVCSTVRFLCSEHAEFITGADIPVCGGIAM
jgi:3-oxoacyl-[acyl-carrier protein] reductase